MAARAYWKGYLKLSLVSCPIALYPASSSSERVSFYRINKKTGNRLKQRRVDAETGDVVDKEAIGRAMKSERVRTSASRTTSSCSEANRLLDTPKKLPFPPALAQMYSVSESVCRRGSRLMILDSRMDH